MNRDLPIPHDADANAAPTRKPVDANPKTAMQIHEAALRRAASVARVAKYFKHRWPDRARGDFSNEEPRAAPDQTAERTAPVDAGNVESPLQEARAIAQALHAAENEGWKPLMVSTRIVQERGIASRRAGVRRSVHAR